MLRLAAMRWMASAMKRACCSLSMTQGPAMRKRPPRPTGTVPISKSCWGIEERITASRPVGKWAIEVPWRFEMTQPNIMQPNLMQPNLEMRTREWLGSVLQDVRFAFRMLLRRPLFSLVVIAVLGVGIGLNAAMFSIVDAVLLRPLPYRDARHLTIVWQSTPEHRATGEWFNNYRDFEEWSRRSRSFQQLAAFS